MDALFTNIFSNEVVNTTTISSFVTAILFAIVLGVLLAIVTTARSRMSFSLRLTIAFLPVVVAVVIMMVNGNVGAGIAVAGAFSLVRFRSAPGKGKDIVLVFASMALGLILGMGYIAYGVIYTIIIGLIFFVAEFAEKYYDNRQDSVLRITIPEDLDYENIFDDVLDEYTLRHSIIEAKTVSMGAMFRISYRVKMIAGKSEKAFIDEIRTRNGNLEVLLSRQEVLYDEL